MTIINFAYLILEKFNLTIFQLNKQTDRQTDGLTNYPIKPDQIECFRFFRLLNGIFIILQKKSSGQKNFWISCMGSKVPFWQSIRIVEAVDWNLVVICLEDIMIHNCSSILFTSQSKNPKTVVDLGVAILTLAYYLKSKEENKRRW